MSRTSALLRSVIIAALATAPASPALASFDSPSCPATHSEPDLAVAASAVAPCSLQLDFSPCDGPDLALGMMASQPAADTAAGKQEELERQATNPIASLWQIQIQDVFAARSFSADGPANQLLVQPVVPWKLGDIQQVTRITVPMIWTPNFDGPIDSKTGLGDTAILNFSVFDLGGGRQLGVGPSLVLPTASSDFTGQGKWQAGPAVLFFDSASKEIQWGLMAYQNWSFGSAGGDGDSPGVSTLFLQPIFVWHFAPGWYLAYSDIPMTINWNHNDEVSVPIGVKLGAIGALGGQKVNAFVEPFYTLGRPDSGNEWGIKFGISLLFPAG